MVAQFTADGGQVSVPGLRLALVAPPESIGDAGAQLYVCPLDPLSVPSIPARLWPRGGDLPVEPP